MSVQVAPITDHSIDHARTVVHDYDRAGDYYSVWCLCGAQIASRLPCWQPHNATCRGNVEEALAAHRAHIKTQTPIDPATRLAEILGELGLGQLAGLETLCDRAMRLFRNDFRVEAYGEGQ